MGSRYGGLKQLDGLGPNNETIMDYSVFDALRAGFGKIVFVIRKDFEADFREKVLSKYADKVQCEVCFQSIDKVPAGCTYNPERAKPWGTNHAVLMGKDLIKEPFAVINADDFYGKESFQVLADYLRSVEGTEGKYCMVGYRVCNTLSENGAVSRGVCSTDANGLLTDVVERTKIEDKNGQIVFTEDGVDTPLDPHTPVSMNMWGFTPAMMAELKKGFVPFLEKALKENPLKAEYLLPTIVDDMLKSGRAEVSVLPTPDTWFGITFAEDTEAVQAEFAKMAREGVYPTPLFR